jgi:hypothetical protein
MALHDQVLEIGKRYLGPAAEQFLKRQYDRLEIQPPELTPFHLKQLAICVEHSAGLLMEPTKAAELAGKIAAASQKG